MSKISEKHAVGMVFGVFDGLHEGHRHFLLEALRHCQKLIVVVAHPDIVVALKQRLPIQSLEERMRAISAFHTPFHVIAGDTKTGTWSALKQYQPDIILLGYDQERLGQELKKLGLSSQFISSHYPEKFKSSLLNKKD
ncbi:MAG: adenylyltransferase/cytidyltransferase family protein [Candidatus Moranbacteria bacterium]|nr:adenylyltransferase/cytidyltransferase family protein [Candidatus Moranbacteria bacterium]